MLEDYLKTLHSLGLISDIDLHFASLVRRLCGENGSLQVFFAAALVSNITTSEKNICLDLETASDKPIASLFPDYQENIPQELYSAKTPVLEEWIKNLKASSSVVGSPGEYKPIVLWEKRLYLYRFWWYENELARLIREKLKGEENPGDLTSLKKGFERYFPNAEEKEQWQKIACFAAASKSFCVISGRPGSGKTYTVAKILAILLEQNENLRIRLCAPTGKASARLQEAIIEAKNRLENCPDNIKSKIPVESFTIHRLLGYLPHNFSFRYKRKNPLLCDVLVVDETSMVPLILLSKLLLAIPSKAKVILLGDKDQLASVEAGAAFADICEESNINSFSEDFCKRYEEATGQDIPAGYRTGEKNMLSDFSVELCHSFRFDSKKGIGQLAKTVNSRDSEEALSILKDRKIENITLQRVPEKQNLKDSIGRIIEPFYEKILLSDTPLKALKILKEMKVLCSHRHGYYGSININFLLETYLSEKDMFPKGGLFYKGRPIIITVNDYTKRLFNGDVGIIWEKDKKLSAFFEDQDGGVRELSVVQLPDYEPVFAMTVHKSQGSEFEEILMIMPDRDSPLLTRELIYTALTRASNNVSLWADEEIFKNAVERSTTRNSGLRQALKNFSA